MKDMLEDDYEVLLAENGLEALKILRDNSEILSIILLDLIMPQMDGYEFMKEVGKDSTLSRIPIIILTAESSAEVKSLRMGAADFLPKPYNEPEVIKARVEKTIQLFESKNLISATSHDSLTGLFRREFFFNYAGIADQYSPDEKMDVIAVDINRFHMINEIHGREYGNHILKKIGKSIKEYSEQKGGTACRSDSNVFFLYIPHQDNPEEILRIITPDDINISFRVGIYSSADKNINIANRFDCALLACNSIKDNYSSNLAFYDDAMHEKVAYEERLMSDLPKAIGEKQFIVFYQPKYAIQSEKPVLASAEALIRWKHPEFGMVSPGAFIPLCENNGKIHELDLYVWKAAAEQVAQWKEKFGVTVPVSVNVSRVDILEEIFVDRIREIVNDAGISPEEYMLEVTESACTEDSDMIIKKICELRELGFRIEMDDFGTGYSSLNMISSMPIDILKLDRGFVKNIQDDPKNFGMVEIVMDIAKLLGVKVVAEGVENEVQHELLKKVGVDVIQGFYYSRPVPAEEFEKFISSN